ncbi:MAG: hypothetical protein CMJ89_06150 [Planctomycetes bacterium]|jgi:hypothetical protein|nr:hypothetical protein [Planctomycetota bacterium]
MLRSRFFGEYSLVIPMRLAVTLTALFLFGCNQGASTRFIIPALPDTRPLELAELFEAEYPLSIQFSNSPPLDPLWAAFEGDMTMVFREPALDGGPFVDLAIQQGLGGLEPNCMGAAGVGPYDYDVLDGAMMTDIDLGDDNTTVIHIEGTIEKEFFLERLPDVVEVLPDETVTVVEYVVLFRIIGSGTWSFSVLDGTCPALPGPNGGPWTMEVVETLAEPGDEGEGEGEGEGETPFTLLGVQHVVVFGDGGDLVGEVTTEFLSEPPRD